MNAREMTQTVAAATVLLAAVACSSPPKPAQPLGPPVPSGATLIPGDPMEPTPTAASPKIPASQQEAQDTVLRYLQQTVDALPKGTVLDGSRYRVGDGTAYCEDDPADENAPVELEDWRDMTLPPGTDFNALIAETGEVWKSWGWQVIERDGFVKPNRFGYAPDGYKLQIESRDDPKQPPSITAVSPCFPGNLRDSNVRRPLTIEQSQ
jgi:hypothetical protein